MPNTTGSPSRCRGHQRAPRPLKAKGPWPNVYPQGVALLILYISTGWGTITDKHKARVLAQIVSEQLALSFLNLKLRLTHSEKCRFEACEATSFNSISQRTKEATSICYQSESSESRWVLVQAERGISRSRLWFWETETLVLLSKQIMKVTELIDY